ncbi:hypothetical protein GCM10023206_09980 [Acinetobacter puyangensis]|uniref:Uncharacterized protein n=1 Tax=Acinetobacter puyangensis TaxID=1096779 RepID=A0A240ECP8_9GAMM|nr:hypothetical protein [Acinetobacter puyangensis]SNX45690.1 hypothetical protein SAMN05421731_105245 [Acinetobacter puyangensis]
MFSPTVANMRPDVYQLQAQSNAFGSREALRNKLLKKAGEICGSVGFDELDANNNITNHFTSYNSGMVIPVSTKAAIMTIKCKE